MDALIQHKFDVGKQVNGGHFLYVGSYDTKEEAIAIAESRLAYHLERCPKDHVEFVVSTPWSRTMVKRIHNGV